MLTTAGVRLAVYPISALAALTTAGVIIRDVGPERYGTITLITTLSLLLPFADLGLSAGIVNIYATEDRDRTALLRIAWSYLWTSAFALVALTLVVQNTVGWSNILGVDSSSVSPGLITSVLVVVILAVPFGVGQRILIGLGRVPTATAIGMLFPLMSVALTLTVHFSSRHEMFVLVPSVTQLITSAAILVAALTVSGTPAVELLRLSHGTREQRRRLTSTGAPMLVIVTGLAVAFHLDRLVLSHRSTASALATYAVGFTLYTPAWALISAVAMNLWPHFARNRSTLETRADSREFWRRWREVAIWVLPFVTVFAISAPWITILWAGESIGVEFWWLLAGLLLVQTLHLPAGMYLTDSRGLKFQAATVICMATMNFGLTIMLAPSMGASGPVVASIASVASCQLMPCLWFVGRSTRGTVDTRSRSNRGNRQAQTTESRE